MYVVIAIENHPDRCIHEVFGPFEFDKASKFAQESSEAPSNITPSGHRFMRYVCYPLSVD